MLASSAFSGLFVDSSLADKRSHSSEDLIHSPTRMASRKLSLPDSPLPTTGNDDSLVD
jgi:hypothetical protein